MSKHTDLKSLKASNEQLQHIRECWKGVRRARSARREALRCGERVRAASCDHYELSMWHQIEVACHCLAADAKERQRKLEGKGADL